MTIGPRRRIAVLFASYLSVALASCGGAPPPSPGGTSLVQHPFYGEFRGASFNFDPFPSVEAITKSSTTVISGHLLSVGEGRTRGGKHGERGTLASALMRVQVEEVLHGTIEPADAIVQVEVFRPKLASIAEMSKNRPEGRLVLFLSDTAGLKPAATVDETGVDLDRSRPLYILNGGGQAYLAQFGGQVVAPLLLGEVPQYLASAEPDDLDDLAELISTVPSQ